MYFNALILIYNAIFFVYASIEMSMLDDDYSLMVYMPILTLFQNLMVFNFTIRYYKLARTMHIYFNTSVDM